MLINLGTTCIKYEDLLNIRIVLQEGKHLVQAMVYHENANYQILPYDLYTAKDAQDALRFIGELSEKNNCSFARYHNEKVKPPTLQLWPVQPENTQGVHGETQPASGPDTNASKGGYVDGSTIKDIGSHVVESGPAEA